MDDGQVIPLTGQANGRAVNLIFRLEGEQYLFGTGTSTEPLYTCSGVLGGGFTGPQLGDSGDWLARGEGLPTEPIEFRCGQELGNYCECQGVEDCGDLAQTGICKTRIREQDPETGKATPGIGYCVYRD
jgi:hypothetical protein